MSQRRCEDCGEYTFFNHSMSSRTPEGWRHTHFGCEKAAQALAEMPIAYDSAIQALVEIGDVLGGFICGSAEVYNDPKHLQKVVHAAYVLALDGIRWPVDEDAAA